MSNLIHIIGGLYMTKSELNTLQKLMEKEDTKGKKLLDQFIWLNTSKPKYEIGNYYIITDIGHRIYGVPLENKKAKLIKIINMSPEKQYLYKFELEFETTDGRHLTSIACVTERYIGRRVCDNHNVVTALDKHAESIGVALNGDRAW